MKIGAKFFLISLIISAMPVVTFAWLCKGAPFVQSEEFQTAITVSLAMVVLLGFANPPLTMRWLFLNQIRRIKDFCAGVHHGNYSFFNLPDAPEEKSGENELTALMREMNWMANQIRVRETQLMDMVAKVETAKRAVEQSEAHYRQLIENMGDMIFTIDPEGKFTFASKHAKDIFGYNPESLLGGDIRKFILSESISVFEENHKRQILGQTIHPYEIKFVTPDGRYIPVEVNTSSFYDAEEKLVGVEGIARDMTEHKRLEADLLQARKMEAIGTLTGGVAHDFNNILQTISGFTELLLIGKGEDSPDYKRLTHIATQTRRAGKLIKQLLIFSRKAESRPRPLILNSEIEKLKDILTRTIPRMIDIKFDLTDEIKTVSIDPGEIEQIIVNLAINARDAMPDGGELVIQTENVTLRENCRNCPGAAPGRYVLLTVSDTGAGMDRDTLERIFEPFYTTKEVGSGTGLGLAMVHGIVKNHKGYIRCLSAPDKGTAFKIYLPVSEAEKGNRKGAQEQEEEMAGGEETILLVDDERGIREWGKEFLEDYGYDVVTAESGEDALAKVKGHGLQQSGDGFDLVILDMNMPGMGGYKCFQKLMKIKPDIKIIIASGYLVSEQIKEALESGAKEFVGKPYKLRDMLRKMRGVLDENCEYTTSGNGCGLQ
ncbi:MAG: PAS domain S-box protein [Proteobacteria bacterium]|nr:PAS domain S-box protein [Pseudomonadota bacterium]